MRTIAMHLLRITQLRYIKNTQAQRSLPFGRRPATTIIRWWQWRRWILSLFACIYVFVVHSRAQTEEYTKTKKERERKIDSNTIE